MQKDFDGWNTEKKDINGRQRAPFCHPREVWWCALGVNIGSEQDGTDKEYRRPVLILRVFSANTCLVVPLTASGKQHPLRLSVGAVGNKEAYAILSQVRVIDTKRLVRKIGQVGKNIFESIRRTARELL